jgi:hypothetical protein
MSQESIWFLFYDSIPSGGQTALSPLEAEGVGVCLMLDVIGRRKALNGYANYLRSVFCIADRGRA